MGLPGVSRYILPDPQCSHKRKGIVTSGDYKTGPHAATDVCDRPECIADAQAWATATTGLPAEHRSDKERDG